MVVVFLPPLSVDHGEEFTRDTDESHSWRAEEKLLWTEGKMEVERGFTI